MIVINFATNSPQQLNSLLYFHEINKRILELNKRNHVGIDIFRRLSHQVYIQVGFGLSIYIGGRQVIFDDEVKKFDKFELERQNQTFESIESLANSKNSMSRDLY